jgi:hypothetical protein
MKHAANRRILRFAGLQTLNLSSVKINCQLRVKSSYQRFGFNQNFLLLSSRKVSTTFME